MVVSPVEPSERLVRPFQLDDIDETGDDEVGPDVGCRRTSPPESNRARASAGLVKFA